MPQIVQFINSPRAFNLSVALGSGDLTLAPPSYSGWPAAGWFPLKSESEIFYVTDASIHPWPLTRGEEGTTAAHHPAGAVVFPPITAGALDQIVAGDQAGTLAATGRELDLTAGAYVGQSGAKVAVAVAGTGQQTLTDAAHVAWDLSLGNGLVTIAANRMLDNPTNPLAGATYRLIVVQGTGGSRLLTYGAAFKFPAATPPTLSTAVGKTDVLTFLAVAGGDFYLVGFAADLS